MERTEIIAALGPTNTGKTHRAIQRMLEHESGMMGLPLRLLAREVYDKVAKRVGADQVALITGEEKCHPRRARFFICTVEAMPEDREVDFVAIDEVQLAAHRERGHVFTHRLLHARGRRETWFMGSDSMLPLIQQLVPTAQHRRFPRLSTLSCEGSYTLGSLPRRSAVVAFSMSRVYEIAEKLRARKGGAAIVLGALSPRARNAQVEMYQSGEVDYLVATDAIGMGLNLSLERVAFADTRKFDGSDLRDLEVSELAQIAGRAGRHLENGGFGTFERNRLPQNLERAIENHHFPQIRSLFWRNHELDFSGPQKLLDSLHRPPPGGCLKMVAHAEDTDTLVKLLSRPEVRELVTCEERLRLLWDVCQIPDYRKLLLDEHANLVFDIFTQLITHAVLPQRFLSERLERLAGHPGDIESIMSRIAFVRTWTYVACHERWTEDSERFRKQTSTLEDELSDALHVALMERFVQRRRASRATGRSSPVPGTEETTRNLSFAEQLNHLETQLFGTEENSSPDAAEIACSAEHKDFSLDAMGSISCAGEQVGQLISSRRATEPSAVTIGTPSGTEIDRRLSARLRAFLKDYVGECLGVLAPGRLPEESSAMRGLLYQLRQNMGCVPMSELESQVAALSGQEKKVLRSQGLVLGRRICFLRSALKASAITKRTPLLRWAMHGSLPRGTTLGANTPLRDPHLAGRPSFAPRREELQLDWMALGYARIGSHAIRCDLVEKLQALPPECSEKDRLRQVSGILGIKKGEAKKLIHALSRFSPP